MARFIPECLYPIQTKCPLKGKIPPKLPFSSNLPLGGLGLKKAASKTVLMSFTTFKTCKQVHISACMWCYGVKLQHSIRAVMGAPQALSSSGLGRGTIDIA